MRDVFLDLQQAAAATSNQLWHYAIKAIELAIDLILGAVVFSGVTVIATTAVVIVDVLQPMAWILERLGV